LQHERHPIRRRTRQRFHAATAVLSLAVWLFMAVAETCTPLHAWLHGGTIPKDDDDCAVVALAHGKVESVSCDVPVVAPTSWIEVTPQIVFSVFSPAIANLPNGRGPPAFCFAA
jgi:hypothetical protein